MGDLDAITARAESATPGPWTADTVVRGDCVVWGPDGKFVGNLGTAPHWVPDETGCKRHVSFDVDRRDCEFIAAARTDVPELVDEVRALRAELERIRAEVPALCEQIEDEYGTFRGGPGIDLTAIRDAVKAKPAESNEEALG